MIKKLYSVKDTKAGVYGAPIEIVNGLVMERLAKAAVNDTREMNDFNTFTEDKELWLLGEKNSETGEITPKLEHVANLIDYKEIKKEEN